MEIANYTKEVLETLQKIPSHKLFLQKAKKKKIINDQNISITMIDCYEKFKTELKVIVTTQKPFFYCYYCNQNLCYHVAYLLQNNLSISDANMISLYALWSPLFIQKIINMLYTSTGDLNGLNTGDVPWWIDEYKSISNDIACPVCLDTFANDMQKILNGDLKKNIIKQCEKCLKPIHITCLNTWHQKHPLKDRDTLRCLHCQS